MQKVRIENLEEHYCDGQKLAIDKYLQIGDGVGRYLLAVGESPAGNGWRKSGRAFFTTSSKVVPTGKNFLINLKQIDDCLSLENISFTEIAKCFVADNRKILHACASKTWLHFIEQLNYVKPKLIILLGQKTTEIFNFLADTSLEVGVIKEVKLSNQKYFVLPLYHPSPLNPRRVMNVDFIDKNKVLIRKLLGI